MQHHLLFEDEAAFFQHPPRCRIGGTDEANNPVGMQRAKCGMQRLRHQFRGIAMSPAFRMKMVGQVQAVEIRRYRDAAEANQLSIGLDRPAAKTMLFPMADVAGKPGSALLWCVRNRIGTMSDNFPARKEIYQEIQISLHWPAQQKPSTALAQRQ